MNKNDQEFLVQKIRTQYTEKEHTQLDELKAMDCKVKSLPMCLRTFLAPSAPSSWAAA